MERDGRAKSDTDVAKESFSYYRRRDNEDKGKEESTGCERRHGWCAVCVFGVGRMGCVGDVGKCGQWAVQAKDFGGDSLANRHRTHHFSCTVANIFDF